MRPHPTRSTTEAGALADKARALTRLHSGEPPASSVEPSHQCEGRSSVTHSWCAGQTIAFGASPAQVGSALDFGTLKARIESPRR
jgi:hypothetical protein